MSKLYIQKDVGLKIALHENKGQETHEFDVIGPGRAKAMLKREGVAGKSMRGFLAPMTKVTLPDEVKESAGIPVNAVYYAFAYPLECLAGQMQRLLNAEAGNPEEFAWLEFFLIGGFMYLDEKKNVLRCNALALTVQPAFLFLAGPFTHSGNMTKVLKESGRLRPQPLEPVARYAQFTDMAWINSSEKPGGVGLSDTEDWADGAFYYTKGGAPAGRVAVLRAVLRGGRGSRVPPLAFCAR